VQSGGHYDGAHGGAHGGGRVAQGYADEIGEGAGVGTTCNVPLAPPITDASFDAALHTLLAVRRGPIGASLAQREREPCAHVRVHTNTNIHAYINTERRTMRVRAKSVHGGTAHASVCAGLRGGFAWRRHARGRPPVPLWWHHRYVHLHASMLTGITLLKGPPWRRVRIGTDGRAGTGPGHSGCV
jgi:hypothetical protein